MKTAAWVTSLAGLAIGCGSAPPTGTLDNQPAPPPGREGPHPAAVVFIAAAGGVMELACWDPDRGAIDSLRPPGDDDDGAIDHCGPRAAAVVDGNGLVRGSDGRRYRVTGRVSDQCEASGPTLVAALAPADGSPAPARGPAIAVAPPEVDVDYRAIAVGVAPQPAAVRAKLAALATADHLHDPHVDRAHRITAAELTVVQVVDLDLDGDGRTDRLISALVPGGYAEYLWSGLVLLPGGQLDAAVTLTFGTLSRLVIDGSLDLDGDGARELTYLAEYYEGASVGLARIVGGKLVFVGSYGCGA